MMGQSRPIVRTTDQSKDRWLGGGTRLFSTHKLTARAACVACPGNMTALKPALRLGEELHLFVKVVLNP